MNSSRIRQVVAMCLPMSHLANTIELVHPSTHLSAQPKGKSIGSAVQLFLHSSRQKVSILYNGHPYPPELPLSDRATDRPTHHATRCDAE